MKIKKQTQKQAQKWQLYVYDCELFLRHILWVINNMLAKIIMD